jgi:hypothetical protein
MNTIRKNRNENAENGTHHGRNEKKLVHRERDEKNKEEISQTT